jgi:hypothetical protein
MINRDKKPQIGNSRRSRSFRASLHRSQISRPARNASPARIAPRSGAGGRSDAGGEFVSDAGSGIHPCGGATRGRGGSPSRPPRRTNHAAFFSLLMSSLRKNGRLGDPALPSSSSNSFGGCSSVTGPSVIRLAFPSRSVARVEQHAYRP